MSTTAAPYPRLIASLMSRTKKQSKYDPKKIIVLLIFLITGVNSSLQGKFMYKYIILGLALLSNIAFAHDDRDLSDSPFSNATYYCSNGEVHIGMYQGLGNFHNPTPSELFNQKGNVVKIQAEGITYTYDQLTVMVEDGAGQLAAQSFLLGSLHPFVEIYNFYFEHEGGYLSGYYRLPPKDGYDIKYSRLYNFSKPIKLTENMVCDFNL